MVEPEPGHQNLPPGAAARRALFKAQRFETDGAPRAAHLQQNLSSLLVIHKRLQEPGKCLNRKQDAIPQRGSGEGADLGSTPGHPLTGILRGYLPLSGPEAPSVRTATGAGGQRHADKL